MTDRRERQRAAREDNAEIPERRRGGQELPDEVQDRPEQNAGYDAAVRGDTGDSPVSERDLIPEAAGEDDERVPPSSGTPALKEIDTRAERDAAATVRRRERRR